MSEAERRALQRQADLLGVSLGRYLVESGLAGETVTLSERRAYAVELMSLQPLLQAAATKMNQVAARADATGELPREFETTMQLLARATARLDRLLVLLPRVVRRP